MMNINSKEFLNKQVLEVNYHRIQSFISNKSIRYSLNFLNNNYGVSEGSKLSLKELKRIFIDIISKYKSNTREDVDDKYHQKGFFNKFYNKLKKLFTKIWNRAFSIVCSVSASLVIFAIGLATLQSLMAAIIVCSIYTFITMSIKYFSGVSYGTNMFYEPSIVKLPKLSSVVEYIKFMFKFIKESIAKVFGWFFYEVDEENSKDVYVRRRRILLLGIILILVFCLIII